MDVLIYLAWWAMGIGMFALGFAIGFGIGNKRCNDYWNSHLLPQLNRQRGDSIGDPLGTHELIFDGLASPLPPQNGADK
jgi:hypothetical protein